MCYLTKCHLELPDPVKVSQYSISSSMRKLLVQLQSNKSVRTKFKKLVCLTSKTCQMSMHTRKFLKIAAFKCHFRHM